MENHFHYHVFSNFLILCQENKSLEIIVLKRLYEHNIEKKRQNYGENKKKLKEKKTPDVDLQEKVDTNPEEGVQRAVLHVLSDDHHRLAWQNQKESLEAFLNSRAHPHNTLSTVCTDA